MKDKKLFGFSYHSDLSPPPKTAEEVYLTKQGDCDELSRVFVLLAERVGIKNLSQFYVNFRDKKTGEEFGHAGVFYIEGAIFYIDPATDKTMEFGQKFKNINQAMTDPEFMKWITEIALQTSGRTGSITIDDIGAIPGKAGCEALYHFEYGAHYIDNQQWPKAVESFKKAQEFGMKSSRTDFNIGQAYYQLSLFTESLPYFEQAVQKHKSKEYYEYLGSAYFHAGDYKKAVDAYSEWVKRDKKNAGALLEFGVSCNNAGEESMKAGMEQDAFLFFLRARSSLTAVILSSTATDAEKTKSRENLENVNMRLKELRPKFN